MLGKMFKDYSISLFPDGFNYTCIWQKRGVLPGTLRKWGWPGGRWGRARPPRQRASKQLIVSREGVNSTMEQEEEGKKSQAWQRGPIVHRVRITLMFFVRACKYYQATMHVEFVVIFVYLFQENKSYGVKPFAFILWCYVTVCHRHVWHNTSFSSLRLSWAEQSLFKVEKITWALSSSFLHRNAPRESFTPFQAMIA